MGEEEVWFVREWPSGVRLESDQTAAACRVNRQPRRKNQFLSGIWIFVDSIFKQIITLENQVQVSVYAKQAVWVTKTRA